MKHASHVIGRRHKYTSDTFVSQEVPCVTASEEVRDDTVTIVSSGSMQFQKSND
jgi:hypothetical protein